MPTYIAFLRAINLGPTRKFPKDAIKAAAERAGFTDVETYINTGNVRVTTRHALAGEGRGRRWRRRSWTDRGFEVPTIVFTPAEITAIADEATDFAQDHDGVHYVSLLKDEPSAELIEKIEAAGKGDRVGTGRRARRAPAARGELPRGQAEQLPPSRS